MSLISFQPPLQKRIKVYFAAETRSGFDIKLYIHIFVLTNAICHMKDTIQPRNPKLRHIFALATYSWRLEEK